MRRLIISTALASVAVATGFGVVASASVRPRTISARATPALRSSVLTDDIVAARLATAKYVTDLGRAKKDGYEIITQMMPEMGYHFLNPKVSGFNLGKPPILVYEHRGSTWQLGALEWIFTSKPAKPPWPGAQYGTFGAACHYVDGTFMFESSQSMCPATSPQTGAKFNFWHPNLITLHVWIWYPNPAGIYSSMNPMVMPFNNG